MSGRGPVAWPYSDGGGVVTRCADPAVARQAMLAKEELDQTSKAFPIESAVITRGRIVHCLPGSYGDGEGWSWQFHPGSGRGSTPAVEWASR